MQTYEPTPGEDISHAAAAAVAMAAKTGERVRFTFNDQEIVVGPDHKAEDVAAGYMRESERRHAEWKASPAGQAAAREAEAADARAKAAEAEGVLPFTLADGKADDYAAFVEKNSHDDYSACTVRYAARWANLMERRVAEGHTLRDCAERASHEADAEGITGFMYGCAVSSLAHFWKHGEELRRWHNLKTQVRDEGERANASGGVLNPAVLTVGN